MNSTDKDVTRIMLVDDDADEKGIFSATLKQLEFSHFLYYAWDTPTLFTMLEVMELPHIIFLDINMVAPNGLQCLKQLKQSSYKHIPVIMYSVSSRKADVDAAYEAGAHYYIVKPHVRVNLKSALAQVFNCDWRVPDQPVPPREKFLINLAY